MASPSVTYEFTNDTTADADQVNQNFSDLISALSGGTIDVSFLSIAVAGASTFNGNTTVGNASSDDFTVTGSLASHFVPKTDATYNLGSTSIGFLALYLGRNSLRLALQASAAATAGYTFTFPVDAGIAGQGLINTGSSTMAWKYMAVDTVAKSDDYIITDTDGIRTVLMTNSTTDRTVTLPTAADNDHRIITVKKVDSGSGRVIVDGESTETIDGVTTFTLPSQLDEVTVQCDGSNWHVISRNMKPLYVSGLTKTGMSQNTATDINDTSPNTLTLPPGTYLVDFGCRPRTTSSSAPTSIGVTVTISDSSDVTLISSSFSMVTRWSSTEDRGSISTTLELVLASETTIKMRVNINDAGGSGVSRSVANGFIKAVLIKYA